MPTAAHDLHVGTNERRLDRLEKRVRDVVAAKPAREAKRVVGIWTRGTRRTAGSIPPLVLRLPRNTHGYASIAPACRQIGEVDLRKLDRHRGATIKCLIPALSCRRCVPNPPFAKLLGLATLPID